MRIAAFSDVGRVDGPDQAWHRDHPDSLSARLVDEVRDFYERAAAFETLFAGPVGAIPEARVLQSIARRAIARDALRSACHLFDRGRANEQTVAALTALACELALDYATLPEWRALQRRADLGMSRVQRRPWYVAAAVCRRLRYETMKRRWVRTGAYERTRALQRRPAGCRSTRRMGGMSAIRADPAIDRLRRGVRLRRSEGMKGAFQRIARVAYRRLDGAALDFPLLAGDVADSRRLYLPVPSERPERGRPLRIGWISTPPSVGSGGHTTMFRMVTALENAGHECAMFLYDRYGGDVQRHEATIRRGWPSVRARVLDARQGVSGFDACVATGWPTAHALAVRGSEPMRRLYFVQDFEPFFYARGSEYALAEDSYRFGFRCVAMGHMVADLLRNEIGIEPVVAEFGCDTEVYKLDRCEPREGVVFYCKPGHARRGFTLGLLALRELHRRRPDVTVHLVGDPMARVPFPAVRHGNLSPPELSELYNQARAGLALSFTNISLLAEELLACGAVPVVNDSPYARSDLSSEHVRWAPPTPSGVADELIAVLDAPPGPRLVAASVRSDVWRPAQTAFVRAVETEVYGA